MAWARVDDSMYTHPKFLSLDPAAVGLWAAGLSYCADHLTDGFIPRPQLPRLIAAAPATTVRLASILVKVGLWESRGADGFQVHDYLEWNDSAETIRRKRQYHRARQKHYLEQKIRPTPESALYAPCDASRDASRDASLKASPDASVTGLYATPRHATYITPPTPPCSQDQHSVTTDPAGAIHLPAAAAAWLHPDGCPLTEFLDRFPPDQQRQCRAHRPLSPP